MYDVMGAVGDSVLASCTICSDSTSLATYPLAFAPVCHAGTCTGSQCTGAGLTSLLKPRARIHTRPARNERDVDVPAVDGQVALRHEAVDDREHPLRVNLVVVK